MRVQEEHNISRADILLNLLIKAMRRRDMFNQETLELHQKTHYPGNPPPWLFEGRDKWKRYGLWS